MRDILIFNRRHNKKTMSPSIAQYFNG